MQHNRQHQMQHQSYQQDPNPRLGQFTPGVMNRMQGVNQNAVLSIGQVVSDKQTPQPVIDSSDRGAIGGSQLTHVTTVSECECQFAIEPSTTKKFEMYP